MRPGYGWVIVGAMLAVQAVSSGFGFYNMSVYMSELARTLQLPLADVSFAVSVFFVAGGIAGMYVARLLDLFHVRWIIAAGALGSGLALALVGQATALWQVYLLFACFGIANTGCSLVVATTLITWWFPGPNKSIALSISSTGLSLGGVALTPASAYLFNAFGMTATMPWIGVAFVVLIAPVALLLVRPPPVIEHVRARPGAGVWAYHDAIRSRFFVRLSLGYLACMGAQVGGISHLYNRVDGVAGFETAAVAVQVLTVCSISGRFLGGWLATQVPIRAFTLANLVMQMIGLAVIGQADSATQALVGAALFGLSVGNLLMLQPLWLADAFPGPIYPRVFALANALSVAGIAVGPYLMGVLYDRAGYELAYGTAVALSAVAWVVVFSAGVRPRPPAEGTTGGVAES